MKTSNVSTHGPAYWSRTGRPVRPYLLDPVTVTKGPLEEQPPLPDGDDRRRFLLDPIHPRLLALEPGDPATFTEFALTFGLGELLDWIGPLGLALDNPMLRLLERYDTGYRHFDEETLVDAWNDETIVRAVASEQTLLRRAFLAAQVDDPREGARRVFALGWGHGAFRIDLALNEADNTIYEQPVHIWSRAWFELVEGLRGEQLLKTCDYCGKPFVARKRNAAYCTGTNCQQRAYDKRRARTRARKEYQREHKRQERSNERRATTPDAGDQGGK